MSDPRPPKSPRKGKYVNIRIAFLNDTVHVFQVPVKGVGLLLWEAVVNHLQLLEADYFDLEYTNHNGDDCWLDKDKIVLKQIGSPDVPLHFCVKFYTPDPGLLEDELTRYLFALQIRKDLLRGELRCSENTAALLASYIVQGEIGDFDIDECQDPTYLAVFKFVPEHLQTHEFMAKVMDYHKQHVGESPSEADLNLLDTARKVELYGVKMQPAKDHEGVSLNLAVAHLGVLVFQHYTKINTFSWAKVRKLSFKRKKFLIKLHADTYDRRLDGGTQTPTKPGRGYYKDMVEFFFDTRDRCKLFWKRCIEHHAFFRCQVVAKIARNKTRVVSRGSSFRYCGRTQKQLVEYVRENIGKRPQFERATSGRISSRSTSATPKFSSKPSIHSSSADLHTSSGSRSSGSHILESNHTPGSGVSRDHSGTPHSAMRVESVDVHSDSSMSGSRSLNSPRLEHGLSLDQDVIEAVNARTGGAMTDDEDDEDVNNKVDTYNQGRDGISHVASDTKGANSLLSPEMNSPVRYVGIYSDVGSPFYHRNDDFVSPDLDQSVHGGFHRLKGTPLIEGRNLNESNQLPPSDESYINPDTSTGHGRGESISSSLISSVCSGVELPHSEISNQMSRPNLDLNLTDSSSSSHTSVDHHHTKSSPPLSYKHKSKSPISTQSSLSSTSMPISTSTTYTTITQPTTSLSASQNANDPVREKTPICIKCEPDDDLYSGNVSMQINHRHEAKKVSSTDPAQQQRQARGVRDKEPSTLAFSPATLPLSPQFKDSDIKRSLDASPSSCVTDIAQSRQDHQVRLTSRIPSVDSNRTCPILEVREKSSTIAPDHTKIVLDNAASCIDQTCQVATKPNALSKDDTNGNSESKEEILHKIDVKHNYPNGDIVGAGLPLRGQLETGQAMSRKLSAGTDLIEDIPYILHRRLDGQKEETALYKVSESDKVKRQRSISPGQKHIMSASFEQKQDMEQFNVEVVDDTLVKKCVKPDTNTESKSAALSSTSDNSRTGLKNRSLERSPSLNRRLEFVNVHKLPSRTSYSSVDDTTSPSGDQEILKQLEQGAVAKSHTPKSGEPLIQSTNIVSLETQDNVEKAPVIDSDKLEVSSDVNRVVLETAVTDNRTLDGRSSEQRGTLDGQSSEQRGTLDGQSSEQGRTLDGQSSEQRGTLDGQSSEQRGTLDGQLSEQRGTLDGQSSEQREALDGQLSEQRGTLDGQSSEQRETLDGQSSEQRGTLDGQSSEQTHCKQTEATENTKLIFDTPETIIKVENLPETEVLQKELSTVLSDEIVKANAAVTDDIVSDVHSSSLSDNGSNTAEEDKKIQGHASCKQYFEISKPHPCHGYNKSDNVFSSAVESEKDVPKSLPLKSSLTKSFASDHSRNAFSKPSPSSSYSSQAKDFQPKENNIKDSPLSEIAPESKSAQQRAPSLSAMGRTSTSSTSSSSENNQFLIDLPSPAAALFYSDNDSPPTSQTGGETTNTALTFSTFRPDPSDESCKVDDSSKLKSCRWSLHSVEEDEESTEFEIIMAEGVVEKSALKKRTFDEGDKPREPKRVSWHEDSDIQHSYHSDLSMTAQRSPVDDCDAHLFGDITTPMDSGNILETLEHLRQQNSESDMTNSGSSSDSSSVDSDMDARSNPKQVYFHYAASKGLSPSTQVSGVGGQGERGRSRGHESSPLESLERLDSLEGSGSSFGGGKFKTMEDVLKSQLDISPLEPLEKLCGLRVDNFDDEGEADDEDDEPNFPPPPPMLDIPEEMFMSYESDFPLPDMNFSSSDNIFGISKTGSTGMPSAMTYSSDSENDLKLSVQGATSGPRVCDLLTSSDFGDLVGNRNCTTSESESDFDAEEANLHMRRMSASNITVKDVLSISQGNVQPRPLSERFSGSKLVAPAIKNKPQVLPKPILHRQPAQSSQDGSQPSHTTHVVHKSQPLLMKSASPIPPPVLYPKPQPPPVHPRPGPLRQPQMGKGKHFDRTRHKSSSSSSSSSSSEPLPHHHHPPHS